MKPPLRRTLQPQQHYSAINVVSLNDVLINNPLSTNFPYICRNKFYRQLSKELIIYTDGAARGNPGAGGYGAVLKWGETEKEFSQGYRLTTNNRMELLAVIVALENLKKEGLPITIYSDSQYVVKAVEQGWLKKWIATNFAGGKKNKDLWLRFFELSKKHNIRFKWVKGHADNPYNNRCDILATKAADSKNLLVDVEYEKENR